MKVVFICFLLVSYCLTKLSGQCKNLSFEEGLSSKLISGALFNTSINSEFLACPTNKSGNHALCGELEYDSSSYDIGLPDQAFFALFLTPRHYEFSKSVFEDTTFAGSLKLVSMPSDAAIEWYNKWRNFTVSFLKSERNPYTFEELDDLQKKMVTVLFAVKSWTFCPKYLQSPLGIIHATFDINNNIVVYNTACKTTNVYAANISESALVHRLFFVCAHEIAHVIDRESGILGVENQDRSERRANVIGLVITLAFSKIFNEMLRESLQDVARSENKAPCDVKYLKSMIKRWSKVESYLIGRINVAKVIYKKEHSANTAFRRNTEWTVWACMSSIK